MVRAPCCEKMGLKKGPWTPEEDQILINYIQQYGHGNWRALPKQAGLLRCGKSCRLRWINYLRPDIKRGNFTREEEDTIIQLHEMLGNRWSAIAARLPGRTDNEIKNVWHTHLKKRLKQKSNSNLTQEDKKYSIDTSNIIQELKSEPELGFTNFSNLVGFEEDRPISPQQCSSSDLSTITTGDNTTNNISSDKVESSENLDDSFWSEVLSSDHSSSIATQFNQIPFSPVGGRSGVESVQYGCNFYSSMDMEFWYNLLQEQESHWNYQKFE